MSDIEDIEVAKIVHQKEVSMEINPVVEILSIDFLRRKQKQWPLIPQENWYLFNCKSWLKQDNIYYTSGQGSAKIVPVEIVIERFPGIEYLLSVYKGKLAIAGGCFTFPGHNLDTDVDIFFYNCTVEEAETILKASVLYLIENYKTYGGCREDGETLSDIEKENASRTYSVRVERKLHVTNVSVITSIDLGGGNWNFIRKYQFIHRIYPRLDMIVGGFDVGSSMIIYDGETLMATELGAWTIQNKTLIIDISRRSTTFAQRLNKYMKREFRILIPGIKRNIESLLFGSYEEDFKMKLDKIKILAKESGLYFKNQGGHDYDYHYEDVDISEFFYSPNNKIDFIDFSIYGNSYLKLITNSYKKTEEYRKQDSDYEGWTMVMGNNLWKINSAVLTNNYIESATSYLSHKDGRSMSETAILYDELVNNPKIKYQLFDEIELDINYNCKRLAEYRNNVSVRGNIGEVFNILNERMKVNAIKAEEKLKGLTWITENPQRQWTSSINPAVISAKEYYCGHYTRCTIGIDEKVETLLKLAVRYGKGCVWYGMIKDAFNYIMAKVIESYLPEWKPRPQKNKNEGTRI